MKISKRYGILILVIAVSLLLPATASATYPTASINSATFYCDAVEINYSVSPTGSPVSFAVFDGPNSNTATLLGEQLHGTVAGTFNMTIPVSPVVADGTTLYIQSYAYGSYYTPTGVVSGDCTERPADEQVKPSVPAYRQFGGEGARAGIFVVAEDNGSGNTVLALYDINEASQGSLLFYLPLMTAEKQYPADAGVKVLIYENADEFISFYRLANGMFQVALGPDFEGKMHVLTFNWDGGEPYDVIYDTYFVLNLPLLPLVHLPVVYVPTA